MKVGYHNFKMDSFCSRCVLIPTKDGLGEDSGWIVSWVHNEGTDVSQVLVIEAQKSKGEPVEKITLPQRATYGFHGTFVSSLSRINDRGHQISCTRPYFSHQMIGFLPLACDVLTFLV